MLVFRFPTSHRNLGNSIRRKLKKYSRITRIVMAIIVTILLSLTSLCISKNLVHLLFILILNLTSNFIGSFVDNPFNIFYQ